MIEPKYKVGDIVSNPPNVINKSDYIVTQVIYSEAREMYGYTLRELGKLEIFKTDEEL